MESTYQLCTKYATGKQSTDLFELIRLQDAIIDANIDANMTCPTWIMQITGDGVASDAVCVPVVSSEVAEWNDAYIAKIKEVGYSASRWTKEWSNRCMPNPTSTPCIRCNGKGEIEAFAHVAAGICFRCWGLCVELTDAERKAAADYMRK